MVLEKGNEKIPSLKYKWQKNVLICIDRFMLVRNKLLANKYLIISSSAKSSSGKTLFWTDFNELNGRKNLHHCFLKLTVGVKLESALLNSNAKLFILNIHQSNLQPHKKKLKRKTIYCENFKIHNSFKCILFLCVFSRAIKYRPLVIYKR